MWSYSNFSFIPLLIKRQHLTLQRRLALTALRAAYTRSCFGLSLSQQSKLQRTGNQISFLNVLYIHVCLCIYYMCVCVLHVCLCIYYMCVTHVSVYCMCVYVLHVSVYCMCLCITCVSVYYMCPCIACVSLYCMCVCVLQVCLCITHVSVYYMCVCLRSQKRARVIDSCEPVGAGN